MKYYTKDALKAIYLSVWHTSRLSYEKGWIIRRSIDYRVVNSRTIKKVFIDSRLDDD